MSRLVMDLERAGKEHKETYKEALAAYESLFGKSRRSAS
jgi:hypothetical protein